jgi:hypothetical protein
MPEGRPISNKCQNGLCMGPENCMLRQLIDEATQLDDLNNSFNMFGVGCAHANDSELIKSYRQKASSLSQPPHSA